MLVRKVHVLPTSFAFFRSPRSLVSSFSLSVPTAARVAVFCSFVIGALLVLVEGAPVLPTVTGEGLAAELVPLASTFAGVEADVMGLLPVKVTAPPLPLDEAGTVLEPVVAAGAFESVLATLAPVALVAVLDVVAGAVVAGLAEVLAAVVVGFAGGFTAVDDEVADFEVAAGALLAAEAAVAAVFVTGAFVEVGGPVATLPEVEVTGLVVAGGKPAVLAVVLAVVAGALAVVDAVGAVFEAVVVTGALAEVAGVAILFYLTKFNINMRQKL